MIAILLAATLTGQVVCSNCWFEADRAKVAYGTDDDLACAKRCADKGIGQSLAVREAGGTYKLVALEAGVIAGGKKALLDAVAATVEVEGELREGEKAVFRVDALRVLPSIAGKGDRPLSGPLVLHDLSGVEQRLEAFRGRIVVLNFWATWCKPCVEEMPDLAKIQQRYGAWNVQVVGAAADDAGGKAAVVAFLKKSQVGFPIWLGATTEQMTSFGLPPVLPGTIVFDRDGTVAAKFAGRVDPAKVRAEIDKLLGASSTIAAAAPRAAASQVPP
ncbi:MAG TPA: TlpA disulfide reductase family protein [Candidatus Polarisedimenticolaceae bacterium]|nr:TlpA disulfide reductase family protein [Candidatus Polarisedimenticolaceae bacterium]